VTPASLTITADNQTMTYGGPLPALTAGYSGFVNGDTSASLTTAPTLSTTARANSPVGSYTITAGGAADPNYTISFIAGTLGVTPAALAIAADNKSMTYGGTLPALTASFVGLVNGDTASAIQGLALSTVAATSHAGSYSITASGASDPDYSVTMVNGTLSIGRAPLTIAADNKSMTYGGTLPMLAASYVGLVNGDTASAIQGLTLSTVAATSHAGSYTITASGATDPDYSVTLVNGTLTITPATLTVIADSKTIVSGATVPALTDTITGFVNGDTASVVSGAATLSTTATSPSPVGTYPILVGQGTLSAADYTFAFVNGTLTVTPSAASAALVVLDPTHKGSVTVSGNAKVQVTGNAEVLSKSQQAVVASGNASLSAAEIDIEGSPGTSLTGNAKIQGKVVAGLTPAQDPSLSDPFAALPTPGEPTATFAAAKFAGNTKSTLNPGTYTGGISVSGNAAVTLLPGLYYLKGGGLTVSGGGSLTGNGVAIYNAPQSGTISVTGNGTITLTPPAAGTYQGIGIFQDRSSNAPITISGNGSLGVTGSIYAAAATLNISGNAQTQVYGKGSLVVYDLIDSGNGLTIDASQGPRASADDPSSIMATASVVTDNEFSALTGLTVATFTDSDATL
ncbi:MAG: MBG domain-containing protein, partial [Pirellulales bacterium]